MAGITLEQASAALTVWLNAATAVSTGQSYTIGGRSLTRADSNSIMSWVNFWDNKVKELSNSDTGMQISQYAPTDT